ncbi:FecR domain-containing protein [Thauera linaloolentis]|uniref:Fe2+-dicitrate sensor, membrane protein n=1 Tax=Thauera linaloolentis (strain DSM 12138 / JCM 21573 / CCUG 41526 / CIP 105981 / IAM 15112 / NBRC 102519 / 47Lol) TaxID=1123367 RepID=N6ZE73_THAL4|nr:FecR domain-containing protein [Thauera linaloolentis]ENO90449.1 Fe2+-dicitrate sensor, membrane protein [Thauera linaloolentis 47Lol = DSM 12138]MCM8566310.1 FecR domain-containing protein [Thauera linaloolentis]
MKTNPAPAPDFQVLQQAAEWFAVLGSSSVSADQWQRWQAWCEADERHRAAWARVQAISGAFTSLPTTDKSGARQTLDTASERQRVRRQAAKMLLLLCGTGSLGWMAASRAPWAEWNAGYTTATGERREVELADGGRIWLNTASAMDVDYDTGRRRIRLHRGEILVETALDTVQPPRPFIVDTAHGRLRALGTRFSVQRREDSTQITVFAGTVELSPANGGSPRVLAAGQQSHLNAAGATPAETAGHAREAWQRGLLLAEDVRLEDFIAELARHRPGYLGCAPEAANLRLVGAYELADTDRVLAALEATLPVRIRRILPWWVVVEARQKESAPQDRTG